MTTKQIEARMTAEQTKIAIKHETAAAIRKLLDDARKAYGATAADEDDLESGILELVTEDE